jgi:hypothetical protein
MARDFFELKSPFGKLQSRPFQTDPVTLLDPFSSGGSDEALIMGEWLVKTSDGKKMQRDAQYGARGESNYGEGMVPAYPFFVEKGRYDMQAMAEPKASFLFIGSGEACTDLVHNLAGLAVGDALTVQNMSDSGGTPRRGLGKQINAAAYVVARVDKIYDDKVWITFTLAAKN